MPAYPHKILNNAKGAVIYFDGSRGFDRVDEEEEKDEPVKDYTYQKETLGVSLIDFQTDIARKYERRSLDIPEVIDYIRIDFLVTFDNFGDFKTRDRFKKDFGLNAIRFYNFNKSVLFEIYDRKKFDDLIELLTQYINSTEQTSPLGQPYAIVTIIFRFQFLSREAILRASHKSLEGDGSLVLELTRTADGPLESRKVRLEETMLDYLNSRIEDGAVGQIDFNDQFITFNNIDKKLLHEILDNFDIVASVQAIRIPRIGTTASGALYRSFDFDIEPAGENIPTVAIIDNGVNSIPPLGKVLGSFGYSYDPLYPPYRTPGWHGTAVAVITACGEAFYKTADRNLISPCRIVSYRVFENEGGKLDLLQFERVIRECHARGIRLFNLSLNEYFKPYNSDYSYFSYLLDKLSYELDILMFISAGNLDPEDLYTIYQRMQAGAYPDLLNYPKHFFYPETYADEHSCDGTNLKIPAESLNNMTVGAIAENLDHRSRSDMTLDKTLPAYYTSKYHISAYHHVNGSRLKQKHINNRLVKPDVVYPGGDYGDEASGIRLTGTGTGNDFFRFDCGTSFAAPFATHLAARIAGTYPGLNAQSIKALMVNSAQPPANSFFLDAHCMQMKEQFSIREFGTTYAMLTLSEKLKVNKWFNKEELLQKLIGHGMPDTETALSSDRKSITVIIEDEIALDSHKAIPVNLPLYLNQFSKNSPIVEVNATLCFKFQPNFKDQTGYNPLHMSFNFIKSYQRPEDTAMNAAYREGTPFYQNLFRGVSDTKQRTQIRNAELGVKSKVDTWSDDFFPNGRQFSNCQKIHLQINTKELNKVGNSISLVMRCTGKTAADFDTKSFLNGKHPYSLVLTFSEKKNKELGRYDFYNEFLQVNQTLDIAGTADLDTRLEAEA